MSDIHFYSAYARTDISESFRFELEEIKIMNISENGMIDLEYPFSYCKGNEFYYFGGKFGHPLDKETVLTNGTAYFSTDKNKCKDFLIKKMKEQNELADKIRERMRESKLEIKLLEDSE